MQKNRKIGRLTQRKSISLVVFSFFFFLTFNVFANPTLGNIGAGNVSIQQSPGTTVINQSSRQAIINWKNFNIANGESTSFIQPAGGVALNRISPTDGPSQIYGKLTATGQIILINPAGIYFGPSAYVNVGGLIASTANITDENFLKGYYHFDAVTPYAGSIINEGQLIAANHGLIALIGSNVSNTGLIQANLGHVVLGSGSAFTLSFAGNDLISFSVDGKAVNGSGVNNTGRIIANGGSVMVSARAAQGVLDNVINMGGVVEAHSVQQHGGEIILSGDPDGGIVRVSGKLNASGRDASKKGGNITVTGYNILLDSSAMLDVSGDQGGGNIFIGGNEHGAGPLPNANATVIMPGAHLYADAISKGNGGNIILWSNDVTKAYGNISARGGSLNGDGGFVETSSHNFLDVSGSHVDVSATNGATGTWLLDPWNVSISAAATSNGNFAGGNPNLFSATGTTSNVNTTDIANNLNTANVTITTGSTGSEAGNITVTDPITWTSTNTLLLQAANNIFINAAITGSNGTLKLSAVNAAQSITTGTAGAINVKNFNLLQGQWYQVNASLPSFNVSNNFQLNSGTLPNSNVQFIRATSGNGSSGNPYVLTDIYGVQGIGSNTTTLGYSYQLGNNIDATNTINWNSGSGFVPIGYGAVNSGTRFTGTIDGQNHTINKLYENITIASGNATDLLTGLFGSMSSIATIKNIGLTNVTIIGTINSTTSPDVADIGSLLGRNEGGTISNTYATGSVTSNGKNVRMGGLIGESMGGTISNSYTNVTVTGNMTTGYFLVVGGLIGYTFESPSHVVADLGQSYSTGLIIINNVTNPYFFYAGGLTGSVYQANLHDSYSTSPIQVNVSGQEAFVGGLVGIVDGTNTQISNSFSTGYINVPSSGTTKSIGGLFSVYNHGTISNNYWDTQTSGQSVGVGTGSSSGVTNMTTSQLQASLPSGFSSSVWGILAGQSYPYLLSLNSATPRAISATSSISGGKSVNLATNGVIVDTSYTGANGYVYFLEKNGTISDGNAILAYINSGTTLGNVVAIAPASGGSLAGTSGLTFSASTVNVGASSGTSTLSNTDLGTVIGSLSSSNILYNVSSGNLTLASGNSFYVTTPTTYTLNGNITATSGNLTFNGPTSLSTDVNLTTNTSGDIIMAGNITGNGNGLTITTAGANSNMSGILSGSLTSLTKQGSGTLKLSAINTYTGTTTIGAGTVVNGIDNAIPTGTTLSNSGTLNLNNFSQQVASITGSGTVTNSGLTTGIFTINNNSADSFNGLITGNLALTKSAAGTLTLGGANTYSNATTINDGIVTITDSHALGNSTADVLINTGGALNINGLALSKSINLNNGTLQGTGAASLDGEITLANSSNNFIVANPASTFAINGNINGAGSMIFQGAGTLALLGDIGNTTPLTSLIMNAAMSFSGAITTTNNQIYNNSIDILGNTNFVSTAGDITFNNSINGNYDLAVTSEDITTFNADIGGITPINNLSVNASQLNISDNASNHITSNGNQTYNAPIVLGNDTTFTLNGAGTNSLIFNNGMTGNKNLTINGNASTNLFTLNGLFALNRITLADKNTSVSNSLTLTTGSAQTWHINAANAGYIDASGIANFTFDHVQSLIGSDGNNTFAFSNAATLDGAIDGGLLTKTNTLDFTAYTLPFKLMLDTSVYEGNVHDNSNNLITNFTNINNLIGSQSNQGKLVLALSTPINTLTVTGASQGYVNDPIFFSGFNTFISAVGTNKVDFALPVTINNNSNIVNVNGVPMQFIGFILPPANNGTTSANSTVTSNAIDSTDSTNLLNLANVSAILQQPQNNTQLPTGLIYSVTQDMNTLLNQTEKAYLFYLNHLMITRCAHSNDCLEISDEKK